MISKRKFSAGWFHPHIPSLLSSLSLFYALPSIWIHENRVKEHKTKLTDPTATLMVAISSISLMRYSGSGHRRLQNASEDELGGEQEGEGGEERVMGERRGEEELDK